MMLRSLEKSSKFKLSFAKKQTTFVPIHRGRAPKCIAKSLAPTAPAAAQIAKSQLLSELEGTNRGIFGLTAAKKAVVLELVSNLESQNPVEAPIENIELCAGQWELLFSTISITGVKRTKLGLREFIRLGTMLQKIDLEKKLAVNEVRFSVAGFGQFSGALTIKASFQPASPTRVDIAFQEAALEPPQLQRLFEKNYDLLLSIFNPQGYLVVTYLDDTHRVGRDDKGNVFVLKRASEQ